MNSEIIDFPYEIEESDPAIIAELSKYYLTEIDNDADLSKLIRNPVSVGPKGYKFTRLYREEASRIYNMEIRSTDTVVASMPRSGTTWTQEIVWLIANDLDFSKARSCSLMSRYSVMGTTFLSKRYEKIINMSTMDYLISRPDPRFIKTHMPLSLLPPKLLDTAKVVYVTRDPRDVAVSKHFLLKLIKVVSPDKDFKTLWKLFKNGYLMWQPFFEHVKEAWSVRHHPNMLFLFYEDMVMDLPNVLRRLAKFFNKNYTDEQLSELCEYCSFDNFKNNQSVNLDFDPNMTITSKDNTFIRKGKVGAWRDYFDDEMAAQAQEWIEQNLRDTDLRYPSMESENMSL